MAIKTEKFSRKPFDVEAIQVTSENMAKVAEWCQGTIQNRPDGTPYIKVRVVRPLHERQTTAFANDWVLYAGTGYKVYTNKALFATFEKVEK